MNQKRPDTVIRSGIPRLVVAGTHSGVGKTSVMSSLCTALVRQGLKVKPYKCGPDYIDPSLHRLACGETSINLDSWLMGSDGVLETFIRTSQGYDIAIIEGVMGYFDGASPTSATGSTAEIADILRAPVLLVCDASGMARSYSALVRGFLSFDGGDRIVATLANRVGSDSHAQLLQKTVPDTLVFSLKKSPATLPERHLGLVWADQFSETSKVMKTFQETFDDSVNPTELLSLATQAPEITHRERPRPRPSSEAVRVGVVYDDAFRFIYQDQLDLLRSSGAKLTFLSALRDHKVPEDLDGIIIPGGYPELYSKTLSENTGFRKNLLALSRKNMPIYAECGGLIYLCDQLTDLEGHTFEMTGVFSAKVTMHKKLQKMGYVEVILNQDSIIGPEGTRFRGHQFRYSDMEIHNDTDLVYRLIPKRNKSKEQPEGLTVNQTLGSYVHAHWGSNPSLARRFLENCRSFRRGEIAGA